LTDMANHPATGESPQWPLRRHIPMFLGVSASAIIAVAIVWPALRDAEMFDRRRAEFENVARALRGTDMAVDSLMVEREAALAELNAALPPLASEVARYLEREADGTYRVRIEGTFDEVLTFMGAIDRAMEYQIVEWTVHRGEVSDRLHLDIRLESLDVRATQGTTSSMQRADAEHDR
jgi:hypothetical protein